MSGVSVKQLSNVGANAAVSVRDQGLVLGTVEYVLLEAVVSMIIRRVARAPKRRFVDEVILHAISVPFVGGLSAPFGRVGTVRSGYQKQFIDGSKTVPAVLLAQYIQQTSQSGFHVPAPSFQDILVTSASKIVTRPLTRLIYEFAPTVIKEHIQRMNYLFVRQENASLLAALFSSSSAYGGPRTAGPEAELAYTGPGQETGGGPVQSPPERAPFGKLPGRLGDA